MRLYAHTLIVLTPWLLAVLDVAFGRGVTIDENTPRPPWEDRPVPELDIPKSMGRRTNRAVIKSVPLD